MGRDGWIGVELLVFGGWLYANLDKIPANPLVPIGPAFYPRFLLLVTLLLSLALVVQDLLTHRKEKSKEKIALRNWPKRYQPTLLSFALFGLYVLVLPKVGYLLSTALFVAALQWLLRAPLARRLPGAATIGVATSLITYFIFEKYLHVFLPKGSWFP